MAFGIFFTNQVSAASNTLNFQSKIVNVADGTNVVTGTPSCVVAGSANDTCDFRVNIYSASAAGTLYFSETHSNVEIGQYNGIFNLAINSVCASTSTSGIDGNWTSGGCVSNGGVDFSASSLWIEVAFAPGGAGSFTETFSRVQIKDVASARYAVSASYLGGLQAGDFVRFAPGSTQTTSSTNSLINLETTGNSSNPLIYIDEDGAGTPDLLTLQTNDVTMFGVSNAGAVTMASDLINTSTGTVGLFNTNATAINIGGAASAIAIGPGGATSTTITFGGGAGGTGCTINGINGTLACSAGGTFTSIATVASSFDLVNAFATTVNFAGAATTLNIGPGSTTATSINLGGGSGATGCTVDGATGDITCSGDVVATGGDINTTATTATLFNTGVTTALSLGGAAATTNIGGTTVNLAGGSASTGCTIDSSGNLACSGTIPASIAVDSLDYIDFEDTMDLDAALTLNQGTNIWTQNFTGTTTVGQTYNVNSLTTGTGFTIASTATGLTTGGNLASISLTGNNVANIGDLLELSVSGTSSAARLLYISNLGTGDSFRVDDVASDTTPFTIDASGNVSVGGNISTTATSIDVVNTTATTVNFAGAANTLTLAGGSGSTGCTIDSAGAIACSSSGTFATSLITASTSFDLINTGATTINFGGAATTLNIAGGSGSTGCTINSTGDLTCSGDIAATGGDINTTATTATLFNTGVTTSLSLGGAAATTNVGGTVVNLAGGSASTGCTVDSAGNFACSGTISATPTIGADSLDFIDFQDTLDLDNALILNQTTNTWSQTFTGTTTVGLTYNVNALTSGTGLAISSTAASFSGNMQTITLSGDNALNIGDLTEYLISGTNSAARAIFIDNRGTGDSLRINDVASDTTPFTIDASGNVSVGGNIATTATSIDVVNTTATTVNFAGAATTLALAGGSGSTGCTINSTGDITCTGDVTATGGDLITTATTAAIFNTGATTAVNIAGAAATTNLGGTTVNLAGGSGSTGCTISSLGALTCTVGIAATVGADSLDYIDFEDTMDLDAALTLNQTTNTWSQTFTGTTTVGKTYTANSLTSGTGFAIASSAASFTGNLQSISLSASSASNTGDLLELSIAGTLTAARALFINNLGIGDSIRIQDDASDGTPFVIDQHGNVTTGGHIDTWLSTIGLLGTPTSITFGGAATSLSIGVGGSTASTLTFLGGSGATGCSMSGNDGAFTCSSTVTAGGLTTGGALSVTGNGAFGSVTSPGIVNTGNAALDYSPTGANWGSTGSTLLLNSLNHSVIAFHDSGARVDFIRVGAGTMTLGYDGGYGTASVRIPGTIAIGTSPAATSAFTIDQSNNTDPTMYISNSGNTSTAQAMHVRGCQITPNATCNLIVLFDGDGTQAGRIQINNGGGSSYQVTSDVRAKKNIADTAYSLEDLLSIQVRDYEYLEGNIRKTGYIAQELYNVYPEAVGQGSNPDDMWAVDYGAMTPLIVKGVQDLNDIVEGNTRSIADLKIRDTELLSLINGLTTRVAGLETRVATLEGAQSGSGAAVDLVNFMATNGTFSGNLNVTGKVYLGNENVGEAKILAGDTEVTIVFDTPFETMPIVQVTPQSDNFLTLPVKYVVSEKAENKFKIKIDVAQLEDLVFNWSVSGTRDGVQIDSDGNVANL